MTGHRFRGIGGTRRSVAPAAGRTWMRGRPGRMRRWKGCGPSGGGGSSCGGRSTRGRGSSGGRDRSRRWWGSSRNWRGGTEDLKSRGRLRERGGPAVFRERGDVLAREAVVVGGFARSPGAAGFVVEVEGHDFSRGGNDLDARAELVEAAGEVVIVGAIAAVVLIESVDGAEEIDADGVVTAEELWLVGLDEESEGRGTEGELAVHSLLTFEEVCAVGLGDEVGFEGRVALEEAGGLDAGGAEGIEVDAVGEDGADVCGREAQVFGDAFAFEDGVAVEDENEVERGESPGRFEGAEAVVADLVEAGGALVGAEDVGGERGVGG